VAQFPSSSHCPVCKGKRLKLEDLFVKFAGMDITETSRLPLKHLDEILNAPPAKACRTSAPDLAQGAVGTDRRHRL
jgi:excinuclease UvrABC ATPase subunit